VYICPCFSHTCIGRTYCKCAVMSLLRTKFHEDKIENQLGSSNLASLAQNLYSSLANSVLWFPPCYHSNVSAYFGYICYSGSGKMEGQVTELEITNG
jgi:hypothetical protein